MKFLEKWDHQLARLSEDRFYLLVLTIMAMIAAAVATYFAVDLHWNFLTIACDTAAFQSAIVNTLHWSPFRDTAYDGPNMLGLHSMFIVLLIAPLYALWPSTDMLFTLQVVATYSTIIPLYLVAQEISRRPLVAFLIAGSALASPLFLHMAMASFHPESWVLAAVLWSYYFYRRDQSRAFWISFVIAVTSGELAALIYIALGLSLLLAKDGVAWRKRYGLWAVGAGLGWFLFSTQVLVPYMRSPEQHNLIAYHYAGWGVQTNLSDRAVTSAADMATAVPQDPFDALTLLLSPTRWGHVLALVGLPVCLAVLTRRTLILLTPVPVYFLMTSQEFFMDFHAYFYGFAFFAGYLALIFFLVRWDLSTRLGLTVLSVVFFFNVLMLTPAAAHYGVELVGQDGVVSAALHDAFDKIPPDAAVYGPHRYSAYLSNRPNMVMGDMKDENLDFKAMLDARYATTNVHPEQIDYIVCDLQDDQCGWRRGGSKKDEFKHREDNLNQLVHSGQWQVFWNQYNVVILKRKGADAP